MNADRKTASWLFGHSRMHGVALPVALILLILVTLIGLAATYGITIQQRMTANFYDREIGFQNAEAALRAGEAYLSNPASPLVDGVDVRDCQAGNGTGPVCPANPFTDATLNASLIKTVASGTYAAGNNAPGQPQFVIEFMCDDTITGCSNSSATGPCQSANCMSYGTENNSQAQFRYYRITARSGDPTSTAGANRAIVTVQSIFQVPLGP